jgi:hypothetical protein
MNSYLLLSPKDVCLKCHNENRIPVSHTVTAEKALYIALRLRNTAPQSELKYAKFLEERQNF